MFPIPSTENLIETKTCRHCGEAFPITDKDMEFYEKVSPIFSGKKYLIPTPTLCPDCRQQRKLAFRNERKLYKHICDATRKEIISIYSPESPYRVYDQEYWWSDAWEALEYGRAFNFSETFTEQFDSLFRAVPRMNLLNKNTENAEYNNYIEWSKNCYMSSRVYYGCEDIYYSFRMIINSKHCIDSYNCHGCEETYYVIDCKSVYQCSYGINLENCRNCQFCYGLTDCQHCFLCSNLTSKEYCIENVQYTPDEYREKIQQFSRWNNSVFNAAKKRFDSVLEQTIRKHLSMTACEHSAGDALKNTKNCFNCYSCTTCEDMKHTIDSMDAVDVHDVNGMGQWSRVYDSNNLMRTSNAYFAFYCYDCSDILYSDSCFASSNLFGCVGLRNKQYCILNKQYTKEEYEALVPKIIEHMTILRQGSEGQVREWGEFFPSSLSPFGYNETAAAEYFPLTKTEATKKGFNWSDYEAPFPKVEKIIPASKLPDDITKIPDDILNWAIECEVTKKPFRIIKQELEFYRKHNLPIPRRHPDQRHLDRMALRNPRKLFERKCDKCKADMLTTYATERPETVYCETCYNKEVIG